MANGHDASETPFMNSLINKANPSPYDQAIFLSEKTMNEGFANMWVFAEPNSPIRYCNIEARDGQYLRATLKAPTVIINVINNAPTLYFQWNFDKGVMGLYQHITDPNPTEIDVTNWIVAFATTLSRMIQVSPCKF